MFLHVFYLQGNAEKAAKQLESQLAELNAKLELSSREITELSAVKSRTQVETVEHGRQLEEAETQVNQLTKAKQALTKQLEESKVALEEESRLRSKLQSDARNLQVSTLRASQYVIWRCTSSWRHHHHSPPTTRPCHPSQSALFASTHHYHDRHHRHHHHHHHHVII